MKRLKRSILLTSIVMTLAVQSLSALNYSFYINMNASPQITAVKGDSVPVRSSMNVGGDLGFMGLRIDRHHSVSMPFTINWSTRTNTKAVEFVQEHIDMVVSAAYQYDFNDLLSLRGGIGGGIRVYNRYPGWTPIYAQIGASFMISPLPHFGITVPLRMILTEQQVDLNMGIGFSVWFDIMPRRDSRLKTGEGSTFTEEFGFDEKFGFTDRIFVNEVEEEAPEAVPEIQRKEAEAV